jgi:hypothetical protein
MVMKDLMRGTTFIIGISPNSKGKLELKLRFLSKFESKEAGHLGSLCSLV